MAADTSRPQIFLLRADPEACSRGSQGRGASLLSFLLSFRLSFQDRSQASEELVLVWKDRIHEQDSCHLQALGKAGGFHSREWHQVRTRLEGLKEPFRRFITNVENQITFIYLYLLRFCSV